MKLFDVSFDFRKPELRPIACPYCGKHIQIQIINKHTLSDKEILDSVKSKYSKVRYQPARLRQYILIMALLSIASVFFYVNLLGVFLYIIVELLIKYKEFYDLKHTPDKYIKKERDLPYEFSILEDHKVDKKVNDSAHFICENKAVVPPLFRDSTRTRKWREMPIPGNIAVGIYPNR